MIAVNAVAISREINSKVDATKSQAPLEHALFAGGVELPVTPHLALLDPANMPVGA